jgi:hypothetical protein
MGEPHPRKEMYVKKYHDKENINIPLHETKNVGNVNCV